MHMEAARSSQLPLLPPLLSQAQAALLSSARDVLNAVFVLDSLGLSSTASAQYNASTVKFVSCLTARSSASHFAFSINTYQQDSSLTNTSTSAGAGLPQQRLLLSHAMLSGGGGGGGGSQAFNGYTQLTSSTPVQYQMPFTQVGDHGNLCSTYY